VNYRCLVLGLVLAVTAVGRAAEPDTAMRRPTVDELARDLALLRQVCDGFDAFRRELDEVVAATAAVVPLPPSQDERLRRGWASFLRHGAAAVSLATGHAPAFAAADKPRILIGYGAAVELQASVLDVCGACGNRGSVYWKKLDDGEPRLNLPSGELTRLRELVLAPANLRRFARARRAYEFAFPDPYRGPDGAGWLHRRIADALIRAETSATTLGAAWFTALWRRLAVATAPPLDAMQEAIGLWVAGTRYYRTTPTITVERLAEVAAVARPGDILLYRKNFHVCSAIVPGFWAHFAVWTGSPQDLVELGVADDPRVAPHLAAYGIPDQGYPRRLVEAIEHGVLMSAPEHTFMGDYVAVLRPRLSRHERAEAVARAFSHVGKQYDFDFDFLTTERVVCSELIFQAYGDMIELPMWRVLGKPVLAPCAVVDDFGRRRGGGTEQFDFVCFVDSDEDSHRTWFATEEDFIASTKRNSVMLRLGSAPPPP